MYLSVTGNDINQWVQFVALGQIFAKIKIINRKKTDSFAGKEHKKNFKTQKRHENPLIRTRDMAKIVKKSYFG